LLKSALTKINYFKATKRRLESDNMTRNEEWLEEIEEVKEKLSSGLKRGNNVKRRNAPREF
jgi:hypothetical protein